MVIDNCHRFRASVSPTKYNPPLIINADRVPALSFASEGLQSVTRWNSQVEELFSRVDGGEFACRHARDSCEAPVAFCLEKLLGVFVAERNNHGENSRDGKCMHASGSGDCAKSKREGV